MLTTAANAQYVTPLSYIATPPEETVTGGLGIPYFLGDDTGTQLTDGILGVDAWDADFGSGAAYQWVSWGGAFVSVSPTLNFSFSPGTTISAVEIGFNRSEFDANILLPPQVTISGFVFNLTGTEIPNASRGFLTFNLPIAFNGTDLQVDMQSPGSNTRMIIDEVQFVGSSGVAAPEPGALALMVLGLGAAGLGARRRRPARTA